MTEREQRLLKGAEVLGNFWRGGERCGEGWRIFGMDADPVYVGAGCACEQKSRFCKAKRQWLALAAEEGREVVEDHFGLALLMTAREFDATGMTLRVEVPSVPVLLVGPKGPLTMAALAKIARAPETLPSVLRIFKFFPGSMIADQAFAGVPTAPEEQFPQEDAEGGQAA